MRQARYCLLIILALSSNCLAQSGWKYLHGSPTGSLDACDSVHLMAYSTSMFGNYLDTIHLSDDAGMTWYGRPEPSLDSKYYIHSGKRISPNQLLLFGGAYTGVYVSYVTGIWSSSDTGGTFSRKMEEEWTSWSSAALADRTTKNWFYGRFSPSGRRTIAELFGGNTELRFTRSYETPLLSVDAYDSLGMSLRGQYRSYFVSTTSDLGKTWSRLDTFDHEPGVVRSLTGSTWFMTIDSALRRSDDFGKSWKTIASFSRNIRDVQFRDSIGVLTLENTDYLYVSTDSGSTWYAQSMDNTFDASRIVLTSGPGYVQVRNGVIKSGLAGFRHAPVASMLRYLDLGKLAADTIVEVSIRISNVGDSLLICAAPIVTSDNVFDLKLSRTELEPHVSDEAMLTFKYHIGINNFDTTWITVPTNSTAGNEKIEIRAQRRELLSVNNHDWLSSELRVFPSPVHGVLNISDRSQDCESLVVMDMLGRIVMTSACTSQLDVSHLNTGLYILRLTDRDGTVMQCRFLKAG